MVFGDEDSAIALQNHKSKSIARIIFHDTSGCAKMVIQRKLPGLETLRRCMGTLSLEHTQTPFGKGP